MIKEFWQERKEEKRKKKQLKKQNKKLPKTKEQIAYKIFGVCFALFLIFGSLFSLCKNIGTGDGYSWDNILGITNDMKHELSKPINYEALLTNKKIDAIDWSNCKDVLLTLDSRIIKEDTLNVELLESQEIKLKGKIRLDDRKAGALISKLISTDDNEKDISLIELVFYNDDEYLMIKSLIKINLSSVVISESLPSVYVVSVSRLEILNNTLACLDTIINLNQIDQSMNEKILDVLDKNSLVGLDYYTNKLIVRQINLFATSINSYVNLSNDDIEFVAK